MRWTEKDGNHCWNLEYSGVTPIVAYIVGKPDKYLLHIWDEERLNFETPIELLTLEDAKNMGVMLVKLRYSEVLNGMAS